MLRNQSTPCVFRSAPTPSSRNQDLQLSPSLVHRKTRRSYDVQDVAASMKELSSSRPSLDGGISPFGKPLRSDHLRLPPLPTRNIRTLTADNDDITLSRSPAGGSRQSSRTPASSSHGLRVGWSVPASRQSPEECNSHGLDFATLPISAPAAVQRDKKHRRSHRRDGRSSSSHSTPALRDGEESVSPFKKKTQAPTEASTPSVVSSRGLSTPCASAPTTVNGAADRPCFSALPIEGCFGWTCGASIGSGSHGCVFKALEKQTGRIFAVKKALVDETCETDRTFREKLQNELNICKELRHPHIVACLGYEANAMGLNIFLEYVSGGSMSALLSEFGALDSSMLRQATKGLLEGLNYLHTRSPPVMHRDIKGANVLVDLNFCVKLSDFGCSKRSDLTKSFTTIGSIPWMAPEVILQEDGHGRKADIWSLGCVIIEMATAEKPWGKGKFDNVMFALRHISMTNETPPIPEVLDETGRDIVYLCTQRNAEMRPSAAELLNHHFFLGLL